MTREHALALIAHRERLGLITAREAWAARVGVEWREFCAAVTAAWADCKRQAGL